MHKVRLIAVFGAFLAGFASTMTFSGCGGSDTPVSSVPATQTEQQKSESEARAAAEAAEKGKK